MSLPHDEPEQDKPANAGFYLKCSAELAIKLGAYHAQRELRPDLSFPIYNLPEDCIEVDIGGRPMIWPIISDETRHDQCT